MNNSEVTMSNDKQSSNQVPDVRKMVNSVEWFSNQVYELFEQYSEGNFDRITLNKLVLKATEQAKAMHKEEIENSYDYMRCIGSFTNGKEYYNETFNQQQND